MFSSLGHHALAKKKKNDHRVKKNQYSFSSPYGLFV